MTFIAFKALFLAHAPDADPEKHRCVIETSIYNLFVVLVANQDQAIEVCRKSVREKGIHSILLCPGFTHKEIAEISEAVGDIGVYVARGDPPSNSASLKVMEREGWFPKKGSK